MEIQSEQPFWPPAATAVRATRGGDSLVDREKQEREKPRGREKETGRVRLEMPASATKKGTPAGEAVALHGKRTEGEVRGCEEEIPARSNVVKPNYIHFKIRFNQNIFLSGPF